MIDFQESYYRELGSAVAREMARVNSVESSSVVELGDNQDELLFEFEYCQGKLIWWRLIAFRNNVRCDTNFEFAKLLALLRMNNQEKLVR